MPMDAQLEVRRPGWALHAVLGWALAMGGCSGDRPAIVPAQRPLADAFLGMPSYSWQAPPPLLSQTGVFSDTVALTLAPALIPYEVNTPLWSDGARKRRWLSVPYGGERDGKAPAISFSPTGEWYFPGGTVLVKHFELPMDERDPARTRRLETRLLVRCDDVQVYGATYRWRDDQRDAELVSEGQDQDLAVTTRDGGTRTQRWHYPGRNECLTCHNRTAGGVLGVNTRQLNRAVPGGGRQLQAFNAMGLFDPAIAAEGFAQLPHLAPLEDERAAPEERVRSYLDANCSHCHRPGALPFVSYDARFETPLERQNLIEVRPVNDYGIDRVRYVKPNDPWRSMLLVRLEHTDTMKMPPLGRNVRDEQAIALMRRWIGSLDGLPALPPPTASVSAPGADGSLTLTIRDDDPQAELHYTVDRSLPDDDSPRYTAPLHFAAPATVRVKALRDGHASSIAVTVAVGH